MLLPRWSEVSFAPSCHAPHEGISEAHTHNASSDDIRHERAEIAINSVGVRGRNLPTGNRPEFCNSDRPRRRLLLDQRALAFAERAGGFFRRDGRDQFVIVPGIFRFLRLLDLEQIGWKHLAAVGSDGALAK